MLHQFNSINTVDEKTTKHTIAKHLQTHLHSFQQMMTAFRRC